MATRERKKAQARREARSLEVATASLRKLRTSARKARVVADLVRGQNLGDAYVHLAFQKRAASEPLRALLMSAAANAVNRGFEADSLVVEEIQVHKGEIGRRFMPRAQGRATPIRKQSTHIDVRLSTRDGK
ncbi:MAG: 50S ribosomal protein L22 [Myxococcaceae bacterium]|nr:50S ribosomal protein L22 [Myxococcaceae bacterium]MBH2006967.1 50S ribosomal protein L22 [Myxococcaceae bacterium]